MYPDLKRYFLWRGIKREVRNFVPHCDTCLHVKVEHQRPASVLQPLLIPSWKWEEITRDFLMGLLMTIQRHDAI